MSDAASPILKIVTALTSPRAAVKLISIALFLMFSGQAVHEWVVHSQSPIEYQKTIILFLGLGLGALVGEVASRIFSIIYNLTVGRYKENKKRKQADIDNCKRRERLLRNFKITYKNMHKEDRRLLWELSNGETSLCNDSGSGNNVGAWVENGYVRHFSVIDEYFSVYQLSSVLKDYMQINFPKELDIAFKNFVEDKSMEMLSFLSLMSGEGKLENVDVDPELYVKLCENHSELLEYSSNYEDDDSGFSNRRIGYFFSPDPYNQEKLEILIGMKLKKILIPIS
ncbi:hypothetical protein [Pectobacterium carotovorum]|uniref:hypothetical protein n=1 Tax=Pectobacterium carotovorum TaxID=554 RepID=UPI00301597BC